MPVTSPSMPSNHTLDSRRRSTFLKQTNFTKKYGKKHHGFDKEKAPYPLSFDHHALDLDVIDHIFLKRLKNSVSFIDFKETKPRSCLDLGCGTGSWIFDAVKEWPECFFVGFDLVNIQPSSIALEDPHSSRIHWIHGNFLTTKLPFEDDEFDHVHIRSIARAVPENKWGYLFEEINRVLRPGGSVEMIEDDIIFPSLPHWYTQALRGHNQKRNENFIHDHILLESLFNSVFDSRFINRQPTAIIPSYFATHFRQVTCSPKICFPAPIIPMMKFESNTPLRQLPSIPLLRGCGYRPLSHVQNDSDSDTSSVSDEETDNEKLLHRTPPSTDEELEPLCGETQLSPLLPYYFQATTLAPAQLGLLPLSSLESVTYFEMALQFHRMFHLVLACQESMWEVLNDRIRNREEELKLLGWDNEEIEAEHAREKFDKILERYKNDMQTRAALWQRMASSSSPNFKLPRDTILDAEDEIRIYHSILYAQRRTSHDELQTPCRSMKIFIGYKSGL